MMPGWKWHTYAAFLVANFALSLLLGHLLPLLEWQLYAQAAGAALIIWALNKIVALRSRS